MDILIACLFAIGFWWLGTGALMALNYRSEQTFNASLLGACVVFGVAVGFVDVTANATGEAQAYTGFVGGVLLWACLELPYLMGRLTGPVKHACPPNVPMSRRFLLGIGVGLYHDLIIIMVAVALWIHAFVYGVPAAALTFTVLWFMRWSAKLNLFLGVSNFSTEFVPERLAYLTSYMRHRSMNGLFPVSVVLALGFCAYSANLALAGATLEVRITAALTGTLAALGLLEHVLLMVPIKDSILWRVFAAQEGNTEGEGERAANSTGYPG